MACVNVVAADTNAEAQYLATSLYQLALGMIRNKRSPMQPPVDDMDLLWSPEERAAVKQMFYYTFIGTTETVAEELSTFAQNTGVSEIMISTPIYDVTAKQRSLELVASLFNTVAVSSVRI